MLLWKYFKGVAPNGSNNRSLNIVFRRKCRYRIRDDYNTLPMCEGGFESRYLLSVKNGFKVQLTAVANVPRDVKPLTVVGIRRLKSKCLTKHKNGTIEPSVIFLPKRRPQGHTASHSFTVLFPCRLMAGRLTLDQAMVVRIHPGELCNIAVS